MSTYDGDDTVVAERDPHLYYFNSAVQPVYKHISQSSNIPGAVREGQSEGKSLAFRRTRTCGFKGHCLLSCSEHL